MIFTSGMKSQSFVKVHIWVLWTSSPQECKADGFFPKLDRAGNSFWPGSENLKMFWWLPQPLSASPWKLIGGGLTSPVRKEVTYKTKAVRQSNFGCRIRVQNAKSKWHYSNRGNYQKACWHWVPRNMSEMYTVEPWCRIVSHSSTLSEFDTLAVENNAKSYTI